MIQKDIGLDTARSLESSLNWNDEIEGDVNMSEARTVVLQHEQEDLGLRINGSDVVTTAVHVLDVQESSPAAKAGLVPGDRILQINGVDTVKATCKQARELMGQKNSVTLLVVGDGSI